MHVVLSGNKCCPTRWKLTGTLIKEIIKLTAKEKRLGRQELAVGKEEVHGCRVHEWDRRRAGAPLRAGLSSPWPS